MGSQRRATLPSAGVGMCSTHNQAPLCTTRQPYDQSGNIAHTRATNGEHVYTQKHTDCTSDRQYQCLSPPWTPYPRTRFSGDAVIWSVTSMPFTAMTNTVSCCHTGSGVDDS